ncbi:regulator of chromosome condensation family protein [Cryptosporidium andersoni]|uniref:Regulator of chromosome condensation family protein n=1 Tax=Cryptosporidium andersoni TaxID=117008 RepID=A0A1J4MRT2_9CRYT|nr:regulator of chromosome condensation family protein [Cryptosporidium andersoni]
MMNNSIYQEYVKDMILTTSNYLLDDQRPQQDETIVYIFNNDNTFEILSCFTKYNIIQVSSGLNHILFLADFGQIFSYGKGDFGQLGLGDIIKSTKEPILIESLTNIKKVVCGNCYSIALDNMGQIYRWGLLNIKEDPYFYPIKMYDNIQHFNWSNIVIDMDAKGDKACFGMNDGVILLWNSDNDNLCKIGILENTNIFRISLGKYFCFILDNKHQLYVWGDNTYGEFLDNNTIEINRLKYPNFYRVNIESWGFSTKRDDYIYNNQDNYSKDYIIKDICCGDKHSLILDSNNIVWSLGDNTYGQCGVPLEITTPDKPKMVIQYKQNIGNVTIACGCKTSGIVSPMGKLFTCGILSCNILGNNLKLPGISKYSQYDIYPNKLKLEYSLLHKNVQLVCFGEQNMIVIVK